MPTTLQLFHTTFSYFNIDKSCDIGSLQSAAYFCVGAAIQAVRVILKNLPLLWLEGKMNSVK